MTRRILVVGWHNLTPTSHYPLGPDAFAGFRAQLDALVRWGNVVPLDLASDALVGRASLPHRAVVLTFDDGYADNLEVVAPELLRRGLPATFFVAPSFVRGEALPPWEAGQSAVRMLDADGVRELAALGFEIGSHTRSHTRLSALGPDELREELAGSRADVEQLIGRTIRSLAYPFGGRGDYTSEAVCAAAAAGYRIAVTSIPGWNGLDQSPLALRRFFLEPHRGTRGFGRMAAHARGMVLRRLHVRSQADDDEPDKETLARCSMAADASPDEGPGASAVVDLSVVVPVYNAAETLGEQLGALVEQEWSGEWDIIVVDNGSSDASTAIVEQWQRRSPRLKLHRADLGAGAGYARSVGVATSQAASFAFCDADDVVAPGWVGAMGDALKVHDFVTGPEDTTLLNPPEFAKHRGPIGAAARQIGGVVPFAPGCNFGLTREALERIGSMSVSRLIAEDVETSFLLWKAGVPLVWVDAALVHYRFRRTRRERWRQAVAYGKGDVPIHAMLCESGIQALRNGETLRSLVWLVRSVPNLWDPMLAERWVYTMGYRYGQVRGIMENV